MDFDFQWLLWALPVAFALGWLASRLDLRQGRRDARDAPRAYFKGLNLLLNEQQDKAIDAFIEAVQHDPDTTELHFALGNLFRRRGEFERAVRVHEHLLARSDLSATDRDRAQQALAQDYMKAGLLDRAEAAWAALAGSTFEREAKLALLSLHERSRDWAKAAEVARQLQAAGGGSFETRISHHECELALEADAAGQPALADAALARARVAAPGAARPLLLAGARCFKAGDSAGAISNWDEAIEQHASAFLLVATEYAQAAQAAGRVEHARTRLIALHERFPAVELLQALDRLCGLSGDEGSEPGDPAARIASAERWAELARRAPSLSGVQGLLSGSAVHWTPALAAAAREAVARAARPLQRYRCAACGFEAHNYFWQCPGCLSWDSYPTQRMDAL
ncbi:MAG: lipopolysaccharide assembly protein LapB [Rubrivivax sp.]|nr:lipopolysaccharide assembly protein LapB [Rubrivivax sp.]